MKEIRIWSFLVSSETTDTKKDSVASDSLDNEELRNELVGEVICLAKHMQTTARKKMLNFEGYFKVRFLACIHGIFSRRRSWAN